MKSFQDWASNTNGGWTLFLDRDGVLNKHRPDDYVKSWDEWEWVPGSASAVARLTGHFQYIIIITNQQGVGKGLMSEEDLADIHTRMELGLRGIGGIVDAVYYCTDLAGDPEHQRKPRPNMGLAARRDFEGIDFAKSIMVGDSDSDMAFGRALGMITVRIHPQPESEQATDEANFAFKNLSDFADALLQARGLN